MFYVSGSSFGTTLLHQHVSPYETTVVVRAEEGALISEFEREDVDSIVQNWTDFARR